MRPFYCRVGSKRKLSKGLINLFPEHEKYVEAFFGGGAVFFAKEPSKIEVINDLDPLLIRDYKLLKKAPVNPSSYKIIRDEAGQNKFLREKHTSVADRIVEALFRRCNGFGGKYIEEGTSPKVFTHWNRTRKNTTHEGKLEAIADYKKRINHATLTEESYESVLRKHDGKDTFFFLDPPYEMSKGLDYAENSEKFDFHKFHDEVAKLKGKFMITINDSSFLRKLFQDFNVYRYVVKGHHSNTSKIGQKDRRELLITNYPLESKWRKTLRGGMLKTDDEEDEEEEMKGGVKLQSMNEAIKLFSLSEDRARRQARQYGINELSICSLIASNILENYIQDFSQDLTRKVTQGLIRNINAPTTEEQGINTHELISIFLYAGFKVDYWFPQTIHVGNYKDKKYLTLLQFAKEHGYPVLMLVPAHAYILIPGNDEKGNPVLYDLDCQTGPVYSKFQGKTYIKAMNTFKVEQSPTLLGVLVIHTENIKKEETKKVKGLNDIKFILKDLVELFTLNRINIHEFVTRLEEFFNDYEAKIFSLMRNVNKPDAKKLISQIKDLMAKNNERSSGLNEDDAFGLSETVKYLVEVLNKEWLYNQKTENTYANLIMKIDLTTALADELAELLSILDDAQDNHNRNHDDDALMRAELIVAMDLGRLVNNQEYDASNLFFKLKQQQTLPGVTGQPGNFALPSEAQELQDVINAFLTYLLNYTTDLRNQKTTLEGERSNTGQNSNTGTDANDSDMDTGEGRPHSFGAGKTAVEHQLGVIGFSPDAYLKKIKAAAKKHGYDPASISFSEDSSHKLQIKTPDGKTVRFGRTGYGDFHIWSYLEKSGEAPKGIAKKKQHVFTVSHSAMKGKWKENKYSPNNLALNLLW